MYEICRLGNIYQWNNSAKRKAVYAVLNIIKGSTTLTSLVKVVMKLTRSPFRNPTMAPPNTTVKKESVAMMMSSAPTLSMSRSVIMVL